VIKSKRSLASDKVTAKSVANWYRKAMNSPEGIHRERFGPEGSDLEIVINATDPTFAIVLLENFAKYGTFFPQWVVNDLFMTEKLRAVFVDLQNSGHSKFEALNILEVEMRETFGLKGFSRSTLERRLGIRKTADHQSKKINKI